MRLHSQVAENQNFAECPKSDKQNVKEAKKDKFLAVVVSYFICKGWSSSYFRILNFCKPDEKWLGQKLSSKAVAHHDVTDMRGHAC